MSKQNIVSVQVVSKFVEGKSQLMVIATVTIGPIEEVTLVTQRSIKSNSTLEVMNAKGLNMWDMFSHISFWHAPNFLSLSQSM